MESVFQNTARPESGLFFRGGSSNDPRLGEFVSSAEQDFDQAEFVILGCPQDIGVVRSGGRPGAAGGPDAIREALYSLPVPPETDPETIFDLGNIRLGQTLEGIHRTQKELVLFLLNEGKKCIILGGGNDIAFPDAAALSEYAARPLVINIDSHYDVREDDVRNSGTPYRQLLDGDYIPASRFYEMAVKPLVNAPNHGKFVKDRGAKIYTLDSLRNKGIDQVIGDILLDNPDSDGIFWGFDLDAVKATDAPGDSAPYATGLTSEEVLQIAALAGGFERSLIVEISEVNPNLDIDYRTARLAAMMIQTFLSNPNQWKDLTGKEEMTDQRKKPDISEKGT